MSQQSRAATLGPAAKKAFVLAMFIIAVGLVFLFAKSSQKGIKIITEGDRAPDFTLSSLDGRQVSLSSFRGKVVMVHFWATWCPPCVEEMPTLEKLYHALSGTDFELLAVSVDEGGAAAVGLFMQRNKLTLPVLLDTAQSNAKSYGTFKFPETYILDRNGIVKYKVIGPRDWSDPAVMQGLRDLLATR